ncbi:hypothetical protein NB501_10615 [Vibrio alginolyticus]|uniref:hypothetical protein n=1 Tax=Vibrio alginolyticus TaxID=663 RepID=UPI00215D5CB4|nr:hypothetical protein [Vibrio alginolyticus]MCR9575906.1 hypothetical protein [Vibrio alginolyticus]
MEALLTRPSIKEQQLRLKIEQIVNVNQLFSVIDAKPETSGAGVIYIDNKFTVVRLRDFKSTCHINPTFIILREPIKLQSSQEFAKKIKQEESKSRFNQELLSASISCIGAAIGWIGVVGSGLTIPVSSPVGVTMSYISHAATVAATAQCAIGVARTRMVSKSPDKLSDIDSNEWYQDTTKALDYISLAGAGASGYQTIKMVQSLKQTTKKGVPEILKGLNRQERTRLTKEIIRKNLPSISNKARKQLMLSGEIPKRYSQATISASISHQLLDAIGGSISIVGSGYSGELRNLAIGIYEELKVEY